MAFRVGVALSLVASGSATLAKLGRYSAATCAAAEMEDKEAEFVVDKCIKLRMTTPVKMTCVGTTLTVKVFTDDACTTAASPASVDVTTCSMVGSDYWKGSCITATAPSAANAMLILMSTYNADTCGLAAVQNGDLVGQGCGPVVAGQTTNSMAYRCDGSVPYREYYSDNMCTSTAFTHREHLGTCHMQEAKNGTDAYRKATCVAKPAGVFMQQIFNAAGCAGGILQTTYFAAGCKKEHSLEEDGTWKVKSRMIVKDGEKLRSTEYMTSDCTGTAVTPITLGCGKCETINNFPMKATCPATAGGARRDGWFAVIVGVLAGTAWMGH